MNDELTFEYTPASGHELMDTVAGRIICSVPVGLAVLDQHGRIVTANQFFSYFLRLSHEQLPGNRLTDLIRHEELDEFLQTVLDSGNPLFDRRLHICNGRETLSADVSLIELDGDPGDEDARRVLLVLDDVTEQDKYQSTLNALAVATSLDHGDDFYLHCAQQLAELYDVPYAYIAFIDEDEPEVARIRAMWADGDFSEPFEYSLIGTPCQDVLDQNMEFVPKGLARAYPRDELLKRMGIESYFGAPMLDSLGQVRGVVAVMDTRPLELNQWTRRLLGPFAKRLAVEWEKDRLYRQMLEREQQYHNLIEYAPEGILLFDVDAETYIEANPKVAELLGYTRDEILGLDPRRISPAHQSDGSNSDERIRRNIEAVDGGASPVFEWEFQHRNGHTVPTEVRLVRVPAAGRNLIRTTIVDISERRRREAEMSKLSSALEQADELVMITDIQGRVEYVNRAFEMLTGYRRDEVMGRRPSILKSGLQDEAFYSRMWNTLAQGNAFSDVFINKRKNGTTYYEEKTVTPFRLSGESEYSHYVSTGKDITRQMGTEARLQYLMHYNPVTDLPNRFLFTERLERLLELARREGLELALISVDIDRFHHINDSIGHDVGDRVLREASQRLSALCSEEVELAHMGADKFIFTLNHQRLSGRIPDFIQSLYALFATPVLAPEREIFLSLSLGISLFPDDGMDVTSLLANSETALFRSKHRGPNSYQFYTADMNARAAQRLSMENALRRALERDEFILHYQPQVELRSARIVAVEALLRWQHPEMGMVMPGEFIPLLEETGLIVPVGEWVMQRACEEVLPLLDNTPGLRLAVNLSSHQFQRKGLTRTIESILGQSGFPLDQLELEITESAVMQDQQSAVRIMDTLANMGYRLSLDDFGTGFSSLSYLKEFPVSTLKLARPFVSGLPLDEGDVAIARSVITLARNLGLTVVAEGVEHEAQLAFLAAEECDLIQGFLFSRPVPISDLATLLKSGKAL